MTFNEFKDRIRNLGFEEEGVFNENPDHIKQAANRANILLHNFEPEASFKRYSVPEYIGINLSEMLNDFSELRDNKPLFSGGSEITDYYAIESVLHVTAKYAGENITIFYINTDEEEASAIWAVPEYFEIKLPDIINNYLSKSNKPPRIGNEELGDYYYLADSLFVKSSYAEEEIAIIYNRAVSPVEESEDIDCRTELIPFLELLTAYYIWLDDDERKAVMYYNQFMELYQQYLSMAAGKGGNGCGGKFTADSQPKASIIGGIDIDNY